MGTALAQVRSSYKGAINLHVFYSSIFSSIALASLADYIPWTSISFLLGIIAVTTTAKKTRNPPKLRYAIIALAILMISFLVPVKTLLFFALVFVVFYYVETFNFSIGILGVVAATISSPAFNYLANVFSFPIRLKLAALSGSLFSLFNSDVIIKGNAILHNGAEFSIDPACVGLSMLSVSLLSGIILIGILQKKLGKILSWHLATIYFTGLLLLNVIANLLRIVLLVQFEIMPGSFMHDLTGLVCFLLYVCVPAVYLAKFLITRFGKKVSNSIEQRKKHSFALLNLLLLGLLVASVRIYNTDTYAEFNSLHKKNFNGYLVLQCTPGVLKLEKPGVLIYVKFIRGFYDTDHNPTICWKGSGYEFKGIKDQKIGARKIYTALISNGKETLYTAWWYGNDKRATIDQLLWRWDMLKGARNYAVINVTAASQLSLYNEVEKIIQQQSLAPLFSNPKQTD